MLTRQNKLLGDCSIFDRSQSGARLRLFANLEVPPRFRLHDLGSDEVFEAMIAWRRGPDLGVRLQEPLVGL
ncbi:MAG: hypothetical protein JO234_02305 [Hyphomicrobiales bacterium]|nr:hypothetical protein [Hyphomicrobiales bacterium]